MAIDMTGAAGGSSPSYEVVKKRHPGRIAAAVLVIAVLGLIVLAAANARGLYWGVVGQYLFSGGVLMGLLRTIELTAAAMAVGLVLGVTFGVMRLSDNPVLSGASWLYVWAFRGTPIILQLFLWFNLALIFPSVTIPGLVHEKTISLMTPFVAAVLGFGINEGAYMSEIIRGGLLAVPMGQTEAALSLGASSSWVTRRIVLPQALRVILPTIGNETLGMLKLTSLAAFISFNELFGTVETIYYSNSYVIELLLVAGAWYIVASSVLSIGQYYIERKFGRGDLRGQRRAVAERMIILGWSKVRHPYVPSRGSDAGAKG